MNKFLQFFGLAFLCLALGMVANAQDNKEKNEQFNKIAKLTQSKKDEDREKAFQMSKEFVKKYGANAEDEQIKKIKLFLDNHQIQSFDKRLDEGKTAEAFALGEQILAEQPENTYVMFSLAYAGFDANSKTKNDAFNPKAIQYAQQTLKLFEAGKTPTSFSPFKDKTEVTALMYYVMGSMQVASELDKSAANFYKAVQYDSQFKTKAYPYYVLSFFYERKYEAAAKDFTIKHGTKTTEDAEMKADMVKMDKLIANMLDAYARAIKFGEAEKDPATGDWKKRFMDVYQFANKSDAGAADFLVNQPGKPLPDPAAI